MRFFLTKKQTVWILIKLHRHAGLCGFSQVMPEIKAISHRVKGKELKR
jgi:hypothetical protein